MLDLRTLRLGDLRDFLVHVPVFDTWEHGGLRAKDFSQAAEQVGHWLSQVRVQTYSFQDYVHQGFESLSSNTVL